MGADADAVREALTRAIRALYAAKLLAEGYGKPNTADEMEAARVALKSLVVPELARVETAEHEAQGLVDELRKFSEESDALQARLAAVEEAVKRGVKWTRRTTASTDVAVTFSDEAWEELKRAVGGLAGATEENEPV